MPHDATFDFHHGTRLHTVEIGHDIRGLGPSNVEQHGTYDQTRH